MYSKEETMEGFESKVKEIKESIEKDELQSLLILNGSKVEYGSMFYGAPIDMIKLLSNTIKSDEHLEFSVRAAIISLDGTRAKDPLPVMAKRIEKLFEDMNISNKSNETAGEAACEPLKDEQGVADEDK